MTRRFNKKLLGEWLDRNSPMAKEKLAVKACISFSAIEQLLKSNRVPRQNNVTALAAAMGVEESDLIIVSDRSRGQRTA